MATLAHPAPTLGRGDRFFLTSALVMAAIIVVGFSTQAAMGRSSFAAPWPVHLHALVFMGWVAIYVAQNVLVTRGTMALHRRLGWIAAMWLIPMVVMGTWMTLAMVRRGQAPFFFQPAQFLVFNPVSVLVFAGLTVAAIVLRRRTQWHRRLHFCGMANLLGPAFGRLLPMPLLSPFAFEATFLAVLVLPVVGVVADLRRRGTVHPAWWWGIGVLVAQIVLVELVTYSPLGAGLYQQVVAGTPGAAIDPYAFAPPPGAGVVTGRN
jgi:hypothetical protein